MTPEQFKAELLTDGIYLSTLNTPIRQEFPLSRAMAELAARTPASERWRIVQELSKMIVEILRRTGEDQEC